MRRCEESTAVFFGQVHWSWMERTASLFTGCEACFLQLWGLGPAPGCSRGRDRGLDIRSTSLLEVCVVSGQTVVLKVVVQWAVCLFSEQRGFCLASEDSLPVRVLLRIYLYKWVHLVFITWNFSCSSSIRIEAWLLKVVDMNTLLTLRIQLFLFVHGSYHFEINHFHFLVVFSLLYLIICCHNNWI